MDLKRVTMSGARHAVMLLARCGRCLWHSSAAAARKSIASSRVTTTYPGCYRTFSDQSSPPKSSEDPIEFPKLPLSPLKHFMQCSRNFGAFSKAAQSMQLDVETFEQLQVAAREVLAFITEKLSNEDYDAVTDRITPAGLHEVRAIMSSLSDNQKKLFIYDSTRSSILDHIYPWACRMILHDDMQRMEISYCVLQVLLNGAQIVWGLSMMMPEHGGSSEEWKVSCLHFDIAMPS